MRTGATNGTGVAQGARLAASSGRMAREPDPVRLSEAVDRYLFAVSVNLSPHTVQDYGNTLRQWL